MVTVSIDGVIVPREHATISIFDRGFLYGDGLFEVLPTWGDLDAHLDRLYASAAALQMTVVDRVRLAEQVAATITAAGEGAHRVRIVVTRGPGSVGQRAAALGPGKSIVVVEPLGVLPREISAAVVDLPLPRRRGPAHKTLAYLDSLLARELAAAAGVDEAIRLDADGNVAECATANLFLVARGEIITPPLDGILPGITRGRVLAWCRANRIPCAERAVSTGELARADEIFATSAVRGVVPITRLDGAARTAGPLTVRLASIGGPPAI